MMDTVEQAIAYVHAQCGLPLSTLAALRVDDIDGYYVYEKLRGGLGVVVASNGAMLLTDSAHPREWALTQFRAGRRSSDTEITGLRAFMAGGGRTPR